MTLEVPLWTQGGTYPARLDRMLIAALHDEGVIDLTSFTVSERGAGANFSVDVTAGDAVITGDDQTDQGNYYVRSTATENVTVTAAPGSNSRIDLVVLQINDPTAGGSVGDDFTIEVIAGTPAASPSAPATPDSAIALATIGPITTSTTSITNSLITDVRPLAGRRCAPGTMELLGGTRIPNGWLACDGGEVSRTTEAALFAQIGTSYGVGDGSTTFNKPDLRGRVPVAKSSSSPFTTEGATGGSKDAITVAHTHTGPSHTHTGPSHTHTIDHDHASTNTTTTVYVVSGSGDYEVASVSNGTGNADAASAAVNLPNFTGTSGSGGTGATGASGTGATGSTGSSGTNANMPPYQVIGQVIIRT